MLFLVCNPVEKYLKIRWSKLPAKAKDKSTVEIPWKQNYNITERIFERRTIPRAPTRALLAIG